MEKIDILGLSLRGEKMKGLNLSYILIIKVPILENKDWKIATTKINVGF